MSIVERCHALGLRTVAGGPITSSLPATALKAEHIVMGEAEAIIGDLAIDLERGTAKPVIRPVHGRPWRSAPCPT